MNPDLLSQLRDIHTAPPVSWWPPAPGWWLLAGVLLLVLVWLGRRGMTRYRDQRRRKQMLAWVDFVELTIDPEVEPQTYLATLNKIFKIVAVKAFPGERCAAMASQSWVDFLASQIGDPESAGPLAALATGPYDPAPRFDAEELSKLTRLWIRRHG